MGSHVIFEVFGVHEGRANDVYFGAYRTRETAEAEVRGLALRGADWVEGYHNKGFVIRERTVDCDFEIPSRPRPRDKYFVKLSAKPNAPGTWDSTIVEVFRRGLRSNAAVRICQYERNYSMLQTFEPFRQGDREFALISPHYTRTTVLDLTSGTLIAEESPSDPPGSGFCPVGFYVPDWWDINDDSVLPGSRHWRDDYKWPVGDFGFVWGCYWGDDSSWKVQYLDLSRVQEGVISRDDRFGYVELATFDHRTPCLSEDYQPTEQASCPPFIDISRNGGVSTVTFAVEMAFDLGSGQAKEWQRLRVANFE